MGVSDKLKYGAEKVWNGIVRNHSDRWVLCIWDAEVDGKKVWTAKALGPGRRSPHWLDIDGVTALEDGVAISGYQDWWWMGGGAEVKVMNSGANLSIEKSSFSGSIYKVAKTEVLGWEPNIDKNQNIDWGEKL